MKTAIIWDERYLLHETGLYHPECPQRLIAIKEVLDHDDALEWFEPRKATKEDILLIHTPEVYDQVLATQGHNGGYLDGDTPTSSKSYEAAMLAAGGVLDATEMVLKGQVDNAFAFPRPPGHHAEAARSMGFCLFNNVAIAAENLICHHGIKKVAIVDYDVHHGNGTQWAFYDRSDVYYISTHRYPFYPGTGAKEETGKGDGLGYTLNVPLSARSDDDDMKVAFEPIIEALNVYKPEFVIVSAGFDAHVRDPLGGMEVTKAGFLYMSQKLFDVARKYSNGNIVFVLEGGYDMKGLQEGVEAVLDVIR